MDERLRTLARQAASGDPQAEAALLRHRLTVRDLTRKRLRIAAYLGHPPAQLIYEDVLRPEHQLLSKWVRGLRHFGGPEVYARVALAAAEAAVDVWERIFDDNEERAAPREAVQAAWDCLSCPCPEHLRDLSAAAERAEHAASNLRTSSRLAADVQAARAEVARQGGHAANWAAQAVGSLTRRNERSLGYDVDRSLDAARRVVSDRALRREIQLALLPWVLE